MYVTTELVVSPFSAGVDDPDTTGATTEVDITTGYSTPAVTTAPREDEPENKWLLPLLICLGCGLILAALAAVVIIYRKWNCFGLPLPCKRRKIQLARPMQRIVDSVRSSISSTFSMPDKFALGGTNRQLDKYAVRLDRVLEDGGSKDLAVVNELDWIKEKNFAAEFEAVKRVDLKDVPTTVAFKQENVLRNRFSNVLPYDRTRVILTAGASGNDYINASYVSGFRKEREFICSQGPFKQTVTDFWQMCWETRALAIIMLTKCYEKNQEKCYPYWPSGNSGYSYFGDIKVTLEKKTAWRLKGQQQDNELSQKDHLWLVSELLMQKEGEERTEKIIHIVFLSWPDFGVVEPPSALVSFVRHVQQLIDSRTTDESGHVLVHCCAGVGRSGVYIAIDQIIRQLDALRENKLSRPNVNVFQIVVKMRRERMGMVQNLQQYALIYKCLKSLVDRKDDETMVKPTMVSTDVIQGSDWGLL